MAGYIVRRLLSTVPVILLVTIILFGLLRTVPGDPVRTILGEEATPETVTALRHRLGLDRPLPVQYVDWLGRVVRLDFGQSIGNHLPVRQAVGERLPATLELSLAGYCVGLVLALGIGTIAAVWRDSLFSGLTTALSLTFISVPAFLLGVLLILLFAVRWRLLPTGGYVAFRTSPTQNLRHLVLPASVGALVTAANLSRFVRSSLLETLYTDYIRTARSKGLAELTIVLRHALRNAMLPIVTLIGLALGSLWEGAVITEVVFSWPGVGRLSVSAINARDYPVVEAVVLIAAVTFMVANLLVDVAYAYLDPRISFVGR